ncbi:MAG: septum formation protein Maf [Candidatus Nitrosotenuis sp.]|nr:MAG: septum formation protein Maf [Candidatus Nitrosotenuis sp.]
MKPVAVVLGSSSPRRREILEDMGIRFTVAHADIDESALPGEAVDRTALRLAREKATKISLSHPGALVIGADTLVALDGEMLGKPDDAPHAAAMLEKLSGKTHDVFTAVAFALADEGRADSFLCQSRVAFKTLSRAAIDAYVATGEPLGKAGAYAIQGKGAALIEGHAGSFSNIVGLPAREVLRFFMAFGIERLPWKD